MLAAGPLFGVFACRRYAGRRSVCTSCWSQSRCNAHSPAQVPCRQRLTPQVCLISTPVWTSTHRQCLNAEELAEAGTLLSGVCALLEQVPTASSKSGSTLQACASPPSHGGAAPLGCYRQQVCTSLNSWRLLHELAPPSCLCSCSLATPQKEPSLTVEDGSPVCDVRGTGQPLW